MSIVESVSNGVSGKGSQESLGQMVSQWLNIKRDNVLMECPGRRVDVALKSG